jgi:hypothetical protein
MSKEKFAELLNPEQPQGVVETIQSVAPGLSLSKILGDIGTELTHLGAQGSHELAAALFNGSPFVMYPHAGGQEDHGLPIEAVKQPEIEKDHGREM